MNDESFDDELDLGAEKAPKPWKKIIVIVVGVLLLLGVGAGATYYMVSPSGDTKAKGEEQAETQDENAGEDEDEGKDESESEDEGESQEEKGEAVYHSLEPVFVVNLPPGGRAKMLQIGVEVMTRSAELAEFLKHNDPMLRHNLLKLFSTRKGPELADRVGKEKLQEDVLAELQRIVEEQDGPGEVEAVYFTSFVMQ